MDTLNEQIARAKGYEVRYAADAMTLEYRIDSTPPGVVAWVSVPDWEHDLNVAWNDLMAQMLDAEMEFIATWSGAKIILFDDEDGSISRFVESSEFNHDHPRIASRPSANIAATICQAWLEWHETKEQG